LLRSEDWAHSIINELQQSKVFTIEPFVTKTEVSQYRALKLDWLRDDGNEPKIKPIYFKGDIVSKFILRTSNEVNVIKNIQRRGMMTND
jgi:methionine aminopeptidase